ncbi:hypothetical protein ACFL04_00455 [Patescibacteria group bacterium]
MTTEDRMKVEFYHTFSVVMRTAKASGAKLPEKWECRYTKLQTMYVRARELQEKYNIGIRKDPFVIEFLLKPLMEIKAENLIAQLEKGLTKST